MLLKIFRYSISKKILLLLIFSVSVFLLYSSDRTDAMALLKKCNENSKILEIPVKNFGKKKDLNDFEQCLKLIKQGKIKLAQTRYIDAKAKFEEYLKLQYNIYKSLAPVYILRTENLIDEISNDIVDSIDEQALKGFESASKHLINAKMNETTKHYFEAVNSCRVAKKFIISLYKQVGKKMPKKYEKDMADINNTVY